MLEIEKRVLPPVLHEGPNRHATLADYYWEANPELKERLQSVRRAYESESARPFRALTLIAGPAGIGKRFIKQDIASRHYPPEAVCKLDVGELYRQWEASGWVEPRADLAASGIVLNRLLAQRDLASQRLTVLLQNQEAAFYIIDSLDEVHRDDHAALLKEVEAFALRGSRDFVHAVVLGRGAAFRGYWRQTEGVFSPAELDLAILQPPAFATTGDLLVSSWNHHVFQHKLAWSADGESVPLTLDDYRDWILADFSRAGRFRNVTFLPNRSLCSGVHRTLETWARHAPLVCSVLPNLAGNGMIRVIAEDFYWRDAPYESREVMEAYLQAWLRRETDSQQRPSQVQPEFLECYLQLFEEIAIKYLREGKVDKDGFFRVAASDVVPAAHHCRVISLPVARILDGSGMEHSDPRAKPPSRYRFEPVWLHRSFATRSVERRLQDQLSKVRM